MDNIGQAVKATADVMLAAEIISIEQYHEMYAIVDRHVEREYQEFLAYAREQHEAHRRLPWWRRIVR